MRDLMLIALINFRDVVLIVMVILGFWWYSSHEHTPAPPPYAPPAPYVPPEPSPEPDGPAPLGTVQKVTGGQLGALIKDSRYPLLICFSQPG
jgi:hypothetical protein